MPQIGQGPLSFRGDGGWRGMTTKSLSLPYQFDLLENVYVSSDGSEIRFFPGWKTVIDPVTTVRTPTQTPTEQAALGFERTTVDAKRGVTTTGGGLGTYNVQTNPTETLNVWSRVTHVHGIEQVRGRWVFFGETSDRRQPISNVAQDDFVYVTGYQDDGVNIILTLDQAPRLATNNFNALAADVDNKREQITLSGLSGALASLLNNKRHTIAAAAYPAANQIRLDTTSGGVVALVSSQTGFIDLVSCTSTSTGAGASGNADVSDDEESLTIYTSLNAGNPAASSPAETLYCAFVANRQRDFGDATGVIEEGMTNDLYGRSRRKQKNIPYRLVPHVAGDRLIMAAPGYGCVFQAPVVVPVNFDNTNSPADTATGLGWSNNDIYDKPRCVGIPKCVQLEDPEKVVANTWHVYNATPTLGAAGAFGGTGGTNPARAGTYKFCFAYKDDSTGDIGLVSEPISITTDAATHVDQGLQFLILFPGYMMSESLALTINVYRTALNGETFYFDRSIPMAGFNNTATPMADSAKYGLTPNTAALTEFWYHVIYRAIYQTDDVLMKQTGIVPASIEQMPMGCKAARTVRGFTLYGGTLGDTGSRFEMLGGNLTFDYDRVANGVNGAFYNYNEITSRGPGRTVTSVDGGFGCAQTGLPAAYAGQSLFSRILFPYPRQIVQTNKLVNTQLGATAATFTGTLADRLTDIRYQILDSPLRPEADFTNEGDKTYLLLPRGRLQISEPDHPGVVPATNTTVVANEWDEDIEGIGDAGGQVVVCTRNKTYMLGFSTSPVGVPAEVATDRFGCIASNSMVSFDGGCAWMSDRGPCAIRGGGFAWIGEPLERFFSGVTSRYKRDSQGMMRHSWACHDAERGLIYFGVFANRRDGESDEVAITYRGTSYTWDTAGDEAKSRFPCDEVLVYSYKVDAWSVWRPPAGMEIKWMTRGQDADGNSRVFFLGGDNRVYALDDTYQMWNRGTVKLSVTAASTGTTVAVSGSFGQSLSNRGSSDTFVQAGMPVLITRNGSQFVAATTLVSFVGGASVTLANSVTVEVNDSVQIGIRRATIRTNFLNVSGSERSRLAKIACRYMVDTPGIGTTFAQGRAITNKRVANVDGTQESGSVYLSGDQATAAGYDALGVLFGLDIVVQERAFVRGSSEGQNHQIEVTVIGGGNFRMSDLYAEVG